MIKHEFTEKELGIIAYAVYSNSSFTFYRNQKGVFFVAYNEIEKPFEIGTLHDCITFLRNFA